MLLQYLVGVVTVGRYLPFDAVPRFAELEFSVTAGDSCISGEPREVMTQELFVGVVDYIGIEYNAFCHVIIMSSGHAFCNPIFTQFLVGFAERSGRQFTPGHFHGGVDGQQVRDVFGVVAGQVQVSDCGTTAAMAAVHDSQL
jgi:hypothetical protein